MGNTGRTIMWIIAFILAIPTYFISLLIGAFLEVEFYHEN